MKTNEVPLTQPVTAAGRECKVYERIALSRGAGEVIRPGGLRLTERALSFCAFPQGARILDIGCGTGVTVEHLIARYGFDAVGIDPSAILTGKGRERNDGTPLIRGRGEALPFPDETMDGVLTECSLSVTGDAEGVVREAHRALKSGGRFIVSDLYARVPENLHELRRLRLQGCLGGAMSMTELIGKLEGCGFGIMICEDHSAALKEFAAQLILSGGALEDFWGRCGSGGCDSEKIRQAVAAARPGYFLLIARKKG